MLRSNTSERKREGVRGQPDLPVAAGGGTEALELGVDITLMAAANSGSAKRASSGGEGRRGKRYPSGLHRHCPATGAVDPVVVVDVAVLAELPVGQALPGSDRDVGGESGGGELRVPCPGPPPVLL